MTTPAPGEPLPAPAARRLASVLAGRASSSLESVAGGAALRLVGFDPLTEVMGCVVSHLGWFGCSCGYGAMPRVINRSTTLVSGVHKAGFAPYGKAVQGAWNTALARLLAEAAAVGADGVVGVRPTRRRVPGSAGSDEFVLLGTAVRARGVVRPGQPFATDLGGSRFAALLRGGWVPAGYAVTAAVGIRHDDWQTQRSSRIYSGNQEVPGFTELIRDTRAAARAQFTRAMARIGAETAVVSELRMAIREIAAGHDHIDHLCEVTIEGTGVVSYGHHTGRVGRPAPGALTVLPLKDPRSPTPGGTARRSSGGT